MALDPDDQGLDGGGWQWKPLGNKQTNLHLQAVKDIVFYKPMRLKLTFLKENGSK